MRRGVTSRSWRRGLQRGLKTMSDIPQEANSSDHHAKPFHEMPGPNSLPLIGTMWRYLPLVGEYEFDRLHHNGRKKLEQFGHVVREEIVPGVNIVWLFNPGDIEKMFRFEGRFPSRRSHLALEKFRLDRPHQYNTGGLLSTNGPEWGRLRAVFQRGLSRPQNVRSYLPATDLVLKEFIEKIRKLPGGQDFLPELSKVFLELICLVAFDVRMGSLEDDISPDSRVARLIDAAVTTNSCILKTDNGPQLWRFFETPLYRKLRQAQEYTEQVAVELVSQKLTALQTRKHRDSDEQLSLLELYLTSSELDVKDVVGMAADMILAGIDTTTYTSSFALYHLATNAEKQKLLHEEACRILPTDDSPVTEATLAQAQYTKAVLKETFRLNPISVGIGRILQQDAVFSGYHVPAGTVAVTQNQVSCRLPEYFQDPERFLPERWVKGHAQSEQPHPFLVLPFGHGPRTCIARRLAEQNLHLLLLRVVRQFEVGWTGGHLDCKSLLINKPDQPLLFTFRDRSST